MNNDEQTKRWNGTSGCAWVDLKPALDAMFRPFEEMLIDAVAAVSPRRVLDVGCGTGSTTLAVARTCDATGIDISAPMIAFARERATPRATFICGDAQSYPFEAASFDMLISRFGVMFFHDPVAAFANLRRAATDDAEMRLIAWRSGAENPFMTTAERAAAPLLPDLPPREPDAPGQFALANAERVRAILEQSGWTGIDLRPLDVACTFPADELTTYITRLGPVGMLLQEKDEQTRANVVATVRAAFEPFVHGSEVRYVAACWMISARAASHP